MVGILLGLALLQDPAALVEELQDDDIEVRDHATRALHALGEKALPYLQGVTLTCRDARLRAADLTRRIEMLARLAKIKGGDPVAGVRAALRMERDTVKAGEPLTLTLELANVGDAMLDIPAPDRFDLKTPTHESGSRGRACIVVRLVGKVQGKIPRDLEKKCCERGLEPCAKPVAPGESIKRQIVIASGEEAVRELRKRVEEEPAEPVMLPPGEYEVHIVYYAESQKLLSGAEQDLKSNVVTIKVE